MTVAVQQIQTCANCGTELAPLINACPACGALVHAAQLSGLATQASEATARNDLSGALAAWREALTLLPPTSRQYQIISARITELVQTLQNSGSASANQSPSAAQPKSTSGKLAAGASAVGLTLLKFKTLLLGLTKMSTLLTMFASVAVYCTLWGWKFAVGLVLSIYVHEMGHVIAIRRLGFKAGAPMFIPGLGALIRLQQQVVNPMEDAEIGLAGPLYGLGAAVVALALALATKLPIFFAIAGIGAWINLFNLLPIGPLDGGRGFHAMSRLQKAAAAIVVASLWLATHDGLLILIAIVAGVRAFRDPEQPARQKPFATYLFLAITLAAITLVRPHTR